MSELIVSGVNYHFQPVSIRERFTIPDSCLKHALAALKHMPGIEESVVLSTCNRTEVYAVVNDVQAGFEAIDTFFASVQSIADHEPLRPNFKLLRDDVALHLFRVASGLDSMILGEAQIMSQVKAAHQAALSFDNAGSILDALFKLALNCGKRVRTETNMGRRAVSVSSAAVELAKSILSQFKNRKILVIGAGQMGQICLKILLNGNACGSIYMANRSPSKIQKFISSVTSNHEHLHIVNEFAERHAVAANADLVIVATSSPHFVLTKEALLEQRANYPEKPLTIIDISVPRNVEPAINTLTSVNLHDCDRLAEIVNHNLAERTALVADAERIVFSTLSDFQDWQRCLLVVPTIAEFRQKIESIRLQHLERTSVIEGQTERSIAKQELEEISKAIVNQILHHPTTQLKATNDYEILRQQAEALRALFDLDPLNLSDPSTINSLKRLKSNRKPTITRH
jgi:glutamyl-tRNA reductase